MIYKVLRLIVKIALHIFFRKIVIQSKTALPKSGPLIIVVNHPNTFMDPIIVATLFKQKVGFLANASVFVNEIVNSVFRYFNVIPVYRQKDVSEESQPDNTKTFDECAKYLSEGNALMIFPEGTSIHELRLRKIKTGTARIALSTEDQHDFNLGINILPIGLYYSEPSRFRSKIYINVDEPINVAEFQSIYRNNSILGVQYLTARIKKSLEENVIITQDNEQEELFHKINRIYKNRLLATSKTIDASEKEFRLTREIAKAIQYFQINSEGIFQHIKNLVEQYTDLLNETEISFSGGKKTKTKPLRILDICLRMLYLTIGFPFFCFGLIQNYIPYKLPSFIAKKITPEIEYHAPIMLSVGIFSFPLYYSILVYNFYEYVSNHHLIASVYMVFLPISGFYCLHYRDYYKKTRSVLKLNFLMRKSEDTILKMHNLESEIHHLLDEARDNYLKRL